MKTIELFPSPTGVLYLLITAGELLKAQAKQVSVPYWGSLSSNDMKSLAKFFTGEVSVPYWGSLSSNPASANPVFMRIDYSLCVAKNIFIILIPKVIYNYQFVQ